MEDLSEYKFTANGEWIRREGRVLAVGLTEYAQHRLGSVVHIELPEPDEHHYEADEEISVIESLGTSADFRAPVAGVITEINAELLSRPELVNDDPYGDGWIVKMRPDAMGDIEELMDVVEYEAELPDDDDE